MIIPTRHQNKTAEMFHTHFLKVGLENPMHPQVLQGPGS